MRKQSKISRKKNLRKFFCKNFAFRETIFAETRGVEAVFCLFFFNSEFFGVFAFFCKQIEEKFREKCEIFPFR